MDCKDRVRRADTSKHGCQPPNHKLAQELEECKKEIKSLKQDARNKDAIIEELRQIIKHCKCNAKNT
jgi:molecular chaperone GrpE (heat shock protein)